MREAASDKLASFYAQRDWKPLWLGKGLVGPQAQTFLRYIDSAELDGLKPKRYQPERLRETIALADSGDPRALAQAELALSAAFAKYVQDMRKPTRKAGMEFVDPALNPQKKPDQAAVLRAVGVAKSFGEYLQSMGWMSPHYLRMREAMADARGADAATQSLVRRNLERARILPSASVRHIVVDIVTARLWYYQAGQQNGTMKVVVGTAETQTPMLAGSLNYAIYNPYWYVPEYLARKSIAQKILSGRTLNSMHMEAVTAYGPDAAVIDPSTIDWNAVAAGAQELKLREAPGPWNSMGKVKFVFPNDHGIYLHDTPMKDLFRKDDRHLSNGCIRLENAEALAKWLLGAAKPPKSKAAEQPVALPVSVPVYLTYLTVAPSKNGVEKLPDVYGFDN